MRESTQRSAPLLENESTAYDVIINEAGALLKDGPITSAHLLRAWQDVRWVKCADQKIAADAEVARDGSGRISLYPSLAQKSRKYAVYVLLREFGHLLYGKASDPVKRRWMYKLALPSSGQVDAVQGKLNPTFTSYRDMVESFTTALDRYVALNIANALIANGVPYAQSQNVKLKEWGPTQEYCNRRRYHVLIPLVSAYASKEIFEDFGAAFADWVTGMCGITESSVADATHEIIREMVEAMR
jgi:hypothetical protein